MALYGLLLYILPNEYKAPIVEKLLTSGEGDVDGHRQADCITSDRALSEAIAY